MLHPFEYKRKCFKVCKNKNHYICEFKSERQSLKDSSFHCTSEVEQSCTKLLPLAIFLKIWRKRISARAGFTFYDRYSLETPLLSAAGYWSAIGNLSHNNLSRLKTGFQLWKSDLHYFCPMFSTSMATHPFFLPLWFMNESLKDSFWCHFRNGTSPVTKPMLHIVDPDQVPRGGANANLYFSDTSCRQIRQIWTFFCPICNIPCREGKISTFFFA